MRSSHSPALDLLRFSTVPSVGFSRGMHCGRGSTTLTHTVQSAGIHPVYTISHYRDVEYFVYDRLPKQHYKHASFSRPLYRSATQTPARPSVKATYQSNTVSLIRSHIDGNYRWGGKNISIKLQLHVKKSQCHLSLLLTLTWRLSNWFHSGFAFFSTTFVCSYGEKQNQKTKRSIAPKVSTFKCKISDAIPSSQQTRPQQMDLPNSFYCPLLQMPPSKTVRWSHPLKV